MSYEDATKEMLLRLATESQRGGQGRFFLPYHSKGGTRKCAERLRTQILICKDELGNLGYSWPWEKVRIVIRRFHPAVGDIGDVWDAGEEERNKTLSSGIRREMELRIYLELLLPPDHPNFGIWTGISPRDLEWGRNPTTVLSQGEYAQSRAGLMKKRGQKPL